jgi:WD40 repeat protein
MIGLDSDNTEATKPVQGFNIIKVVHSQVYAIQFEYMADQQRLVSALSDYSLLVVDLNTMKSIKHIPNAHKKRINDIHATENLLYSCSNDGTVKVWDIKGEKKPIAEFKGIIYTFHILILDPAILEAYSLSQTGDTLAVGGNAVIQFW